MTITAGTASVTGSALVDNGTINVGTGFVDAGSHYRHRHADVGTVANATLTGNTTLGSITDAGTLVLGGTMPRQSASPPARRPPSPATSATPAASPARAP